jgi:hypothetical protein
MSDFTDFEEWPCTAEEYHRENGLYSASRLKRYVQVVEEPKTRTALDFGTAVHLALLEPDKLGEQIAIKKKFGRTKADLAAKADWEEANAGKILLTDDQAMRAQAIAGHIRVHPKLAPILKHKLTQFEHTIKFVDKATGLPCKTRRDIVCGPVVFDLKTSSTVEVDKFEAQSIPAYRYDLQGALYADAHASMIGRPARFAFIVASKEPPYRVGVYEVGDAWLEIGRRFYRQALEAAARELESGTPHKFDWEQQTMVLNDPPKWLCQKVGVEL